MVSTSPSVEKNTALGLESNFVLESQLPVSVGANTGSETTGAAVMAVATFKVEKTVLCWGLQ